MKIRNYYTVGQKVDTSEANNIEELTDFTVTKDKQSGTKESYRIEIKQHEIRIEYQHPRGLIYANQTLQNLIQNNELYYGLIEDGPKFSIRGIIEGFYGTPWNHEERLDVISFLRQNRMNTYMYAPKDDVYHREQWRTPYPPKAKKQLTELIDKANKNHIDFYFSISPGKDFNYTKQQDYDILFTKIDDIISEGVSHFCLLLDDIDYTLGSKDQKQFKTPGLAHAYISNKLNEHLSLKLQDHTLVMCPTEYWQRSNTPYRQDLKQTLHPSIKVFWTGYRVVAEFIPNEDGIQVQDHFGHDLILWDNYPVNDMATDMIFMGPLVNRGDELHQSHIGMVSNPMVEWWLSKIPICTMSEYMWNPSTYQPEAAYYRAIQQLFPERKHQKALEIILLHFRQTILQYYEEEQIERYIADRNSAELVQYYDYSIQAIQTLKTADNKPFINQFKPWLDRLVYDAEIMRAIHKQEYEKVKEMCKQAYEMTHVTGSNYALRYATENQIYDGPISKHNRPNYWW